MAPMDEHSSPRPDAAPEPGPRPWPHHGSRPGADYRIFRSRWDTLTNPRNGETMDRVVLETPDWVNVVAVTEVGEIVVIEQYRFGTGAVTIEIPGGMLEPGEDPRVAAARELCEETGYTADDWVSLGSVEPNPAFQTNRCHHWLARGARRTHPLEQDRGEDIVVRTMGADGVRAAIASGAITHALVVTAIARVLDLRMPGVSLDDAR